MTFAATYAEDHGPDVICLLLVEHEGLRRGLARVLGEREGPDRRDQLHRFAEQLVRHETAEETVLYPILAHIKGGGDFRREVLRQERGITIALAKLLRRLSWRPAGHKSLRKIGSFSEILEDHLVFEERSLIPILHSLESEQKRQMMGTWFRRAEALAPTRPHRHGPQRPAGLLTIGLAFGIFDRFANRARRRTRSATSRARG